MPFASPSFRKPEPKNTKEVNIVRLRDNVVLRVPALVWEEIQGKGGFKLEETPMSSESLSEQTPGVEVRETMPQESSIEPSPLDVSEAEKQPTDPTLQKRSPGRPRKNPA